MKSLFEEMGGTYRQEGDYLSAKAVVLATKDNPRLCRGEKTAYGEGQSRQEKVSELE